MINEDYPVRLPDPEVVARAAAEAPAPRVLEDYNDAISILREKKFTFREIAEWLIKNFNIEADHNSVWRAYTKYMDNLSAHLEAEADEELERNEAIAVAESNGTLYISHTAEPVAEAKVVGKAKKEVSKNAKAKKNKKK